MTQPEPVTRCVTCGLTAGAGLHTDPYPAKDDSHHPFEPESAPSPDRADSREAWANFDVMEQSARNYLARAEAAEAALSEGDRLLCRWWSEDGWARTEARYAIETREYLQRRGYLDENGRFTDYIRRMGEESQ